MTQNLNTALDAFVLCYEKLILQSPEETKIEFNSKWPSQCYRQEKKDGDLVAWKPVLREVPGVFTGLEAGLEMTIHPDIIAYYGRYWSDNLNAQAEQGKLQLLQAWNEQDYQRLQQNIVGHVLMKRRLQQAETIFFALTDEDDFFLSVDNASGEVVLEQVGLVPKETLASDLGSFLQKLQPQIIERVGIT
jgi:SecY interacting protein Syd